MNDNQLTVGIGLDTSALDRGISNAQSKLQSFGDRMQTIGERLSVSLALPLGILATKIFKSTAEYERLELSLKAIEGSAEGAKKRIAELTEVAKLPGIGFEQAIKGDVRLRAVGIAAKTSKTILQEFANAIAFTGGKAEQLDLVTYQLGQMSAKSKVLGNDLRPIIEQAPAVAGAIQQMFGTVDPEIISEKLANAGKNSTQFIEELVIKLRDIPRVQGGFSNALDNMGNALNRFFSEIGTQIVKDFDLTTKIDSLSGVLETLAQSFNGLDPSIRNAIVIIGALAIALPPLMFAIGGLTNAFIAVANPVTLVATALLALGAVLVENTVKTKEFNNATKSLDQVHKEAERSIRSQTLSIEKNIEILRDSKSTTDEVKKAKKELIAINPDYEKALKGEIVDYSELNKVTSVTISKLLKVAYYKKVIAQQDSAVKGLAELRAGGGLSAMDEFSIWARSNLSNDALLGADDANKKMNIAIEARKRIVIERGQKYVDAINRSRIEIAKADKSILEEINKESPTTTTTPTGVAVNDKAQKEATKRLKNEIEEQKKWIQFSEESYKDLEYIRQEDLDFLNDITKRKLDILKRERDTGLITAADYQLGLLDINRKAEESQKKFAENFDKFYEKLKPKKIGSFDSFDQLKNDTISKMNKLEEEMTLRIANIGKGIKMPDFTQSQGYKAQQEKFDFFKDFFGISSEDMINGSTDKLQKVFKTLSDNFGATYGNFANFINGTLQTTGAFISDAYTSIWESLFDADIKFDFKKVLLNFLSSFGQMITQIGLQMASAGALLMIGTSGATGSKQVASGLGLVALGTGMTAAGSVMNRQSSQTGTSGVTSRIAPMLPANYGMVEFEIKGTTLKGVLNNTERLNG